MKFLNDSASFLPEELKNHVILTKNPNILPKIPKIQKKNLEEYKKKQGFLGFPRDPCGGPCGEPKMQNIDLTIWKTS